MRRFSDREEDLPFGAAIDVSPNPFDPGGDHEAGFGQGKVVAAEGPDDGSPDRDQSPCETDTTLASFGPGRRPRIGLVRFARSQDSTHTL